MNSLYDWTSSYFKGGRLNSIAMNNIDMRQVMSNITSQPFDVVKYSELTKYVNHPLPTFLIILYQYPNQMGHWCLLYTNNYSIYFFDPYGLPVDSQFQYLENPLNQPEPVHILSHIIKQYTNHGYNYSFNPLNIQGHLQNSNIARSECGEIVVFRVMYIDLSDYDFLTLCLNIGAKQLFELVSKLDRPKYKVVKSI